MADRLIPKPKRSISISKPKPQSKPLPPKPKPKPLPPKPKPRVKVKAQAQAQPLPPKPKIQRPSVVYDISDDEEDLLSFPLLDLRNDAGLISSQEQNKPILDMLDQLITLTKSVRASATGQAKSNHGRRLNSFIRARDAIASYDHVITSGKQAQRDIEGVGKGIATRIDEFLKTGTLQELEQTIDEHSRVIMELCTVTGIGEVKAEYFFNEYGIRSIDDLFKAYKNGILSVKKNQLTHHILVGMEFYYDLQLRMPWDEADEIAERITDIINMVNPTYIVNVCGSYRRHKSTCGDLDVLISNPLIEDESQISNELPDIVNTLESNGILVGHLTNKGKTKYMGVCRLPGKPGRRIDIRFVTYPSLGAATLYFTGSGKFNKIMRYRANQRGYTLNEYGLYEYINNVKGKQMYAPTEEDIFKILNFVYLTPEEREF